MLSRPDNGMRQDAPLRLLALRWRALLSALLVDRCAGWRHRRVPPCKRNASGRDECLFEEAIVEAGGVPRSATQQFLRIMELCSRFLVDREPPVPATPSVVLCTTCACGLQNIRQLHFKLSLTE